MVLVLVNPTVQTQYGSPWSEANSIVSTEELNELNENDTRYKPKTVHKHRQREKQRVTTGSLGWRTIFTGYAHRRLCGRLGGFHPSGGFHSLSAFHSLHLLNRNWYPGTRWGFHSCHNFTATDWPCSVCWGPPTPPHRTRAWALILSSARRVRATAAACCRDAQLGTEGVW